MVADRGEIESLVNVRVEGRSAVSVVFFGASQLGYSCCERLIEAGVPVSGLVTMPRQFRISYSPAGPVTNVLHRDFHELGSRFGIPVVTIDGKMSDYQDDIEKFSPTLMVVVGWYYMIPERIRSLAAKGCVGVHSSLLPKYRGGAPLVWALINGESRTGVSLFHFASGVDDGDVVAQEEFDVNAIDTIADLLVRAETAAISLVLRYVPMLLAGTAPRTKQDHSQATYYPQRSPSDGRIDWSWEPDRINRFIRAQTRPYPGAFTEVGGHRLYIWSGEVRPIEPQEEHTTSPISRIDDER